MNFLSEEDKTEMRNSYLVKCNKKEEAKLTDFKLIAVLGRGTFGKVYLAELHNSKKYFAIKSIRKDIILEMD